MSMFEEVREIPKYTVRSKSRTVIEEFLKSGIKRGKLDQRLITGKSRVFVSSLGQVARQHKFPVKVHYRAEDNSVYLERIPN